MLIQCESNYAGLLVACDASMLVVVVGFAAASSKAHHHHKNTSGLLKSRVHAEALPLHNSLLQFVRILPSLREGKMRTNCNKSSWSPQATRLRGHHAQLKVTCEKPCVGSEV